MLIKTQKTTYSVLLKQTYSWELQPRMVRTVNMHHLQAVNHQVRLNVVLNHSRRTALRDNSLQNSAVLKQYELDEELPSTKQLHRLLLNTSYVYRTSSVHIPFCDNVMLQRIKRVLYLYQNYVV